MTSAPGTMRVAMKRDRRGLAALEFAMIAPAMVIMIWGVYDVSRALLAWEETVHAAQAVAQAAEKLSVSGQQNPNGSPVTSLTSTQMQEAMTSIYAEMPWLSLGNQNGSFQGNYAVTLSSVEYWPRCGAAAAKAGTCAAQTLNVVWSAYLTEGGAQLMTPPPSHPNSLYRLCGVGALKPVAQFPNNSTQLQYMIYPDLEPGGDPGDPLVLPPQVVADVQYTFTPTFPLMAGYTYTFYASATFPAPLGDDDQVVSFNAAGSPANTVESCPVLTPP